MKRLPYCWMVCALLFPVLTHSDESNARVPEDRGSDSQSSGLLNLMGISSTGSSDSSLLAHWKFDETGGTVARDSARNIHGNLSSSGASFVPGGISGNALSFNKAANGFVSMGRAFALGDKDFSLVTWVKIGPGDLTPSSIFLGKHEAGYMNGYVLAFNESPGGGLPGYGRTGRAWFYDTDFHGQEVNSVSLVNDGQWHQIVCVYEKNRNKHLYIDGAPVEAMVSSRPIAANAAPFMVGGALFNGIPNGTFTGLVDDVQIYERSLTADEVDYLFRHPGQPIPSLAITAQPASQSVFAGQKAILSVQALGTPPLSYQWRRDGVAIPGANQSVYSIASANPQHAGTYTVVVSNAAAVLTSSRATFGVFVVNPPADLKIAAAHWKFDDSVGTKVLDSAGPYDGVLSPTGAGFVPGGISGKALSLNKEQNGYVNLGNVLALTNSDFSLVAWVKLNPGEPVNEAFVLGKHLAGFPNGYAVQVNVAPGQTAAGRAWLYDSAAPGQAVVSTSGVNDGNWHQIVGVYQRNANKHIYIDGIPIEASLPSRPLVGNSAPLLLGGLSLNGVPTGRFTGRIDEVQVCDRALTADEVDDLYKNPGKTIQSLLISSMPAENLVTNGGFEMPPGVAFSAVFDPSNRLPGWTIEQGSVDVVGSHWQAAAGSQSLDLNGVFEESVIIYQDVPTTPGARYRIRFALAGNPDCGSPVKTAKVLWNEAELATVSFTTVGKSRTNMGWLFYEYEARASGLNSRLKFQSTTSGPCGPALDAISVTQIGAPATFGPPAIVEQPKDQSVVAGQRVTFVVQAAGAAPLRYQWQLNGASIPGATQPAFTLESAVFAHAGDYTVTVSNQYGTARSEAARLTIVAGGGPIAHWKFDEQTGLTAKDSMGSFHGTLSPTGASFVSGGISGQALRLTKASSGFVFMDNVLGLPNTDFSFVAWIKMAPGDRTDAVILAKHAAFTRNGYLLMVNNSGTLLPDNKASFVAGGSGTVAYSTNDTVVSRTIVNDGNWHQIVAVYQAGGMRSIFVDGAPAEDTKPSQTFLQNSVPFLIGGINYNGVPAGRFDGLIDEVQIYQRALTSAEVDYLFYNPGRTFPTPVPPPNLGQALLNVYFGSESSQTKTGLAGTGLTASDYWNFYSRSDGRGGYRSFGGLTNLIWADGSRSDVSLTVSNAAGAWGTGLSDPMMATFLYPLPNGNGNIGLTVTGLPVGTYDFYLYGHGRLDSENAVFVLNSGQINYGTNSTTSTSAWKSDIWQEGMQYVVFRRVEAKAGQPILISVRPGTAREAPLNGLQVKSASPPASSPILVTTLAGSGAAGYRDGKGRTAQFNAPNAGTVGPDGMIYIADGENHRIRRVDPATGEVTTLAGRGGAGYADGPGANALFNVPLGIAVDASGNVFVADASNHRIRKISADAGRTVTTIAGSGAAAYANGIGTQARFNFPNDLVIDTTGNLFVSEFLNHAIRKISPSGEVSTYAGNGALGYADGVGTEARFNQPGGLAIDPRGNLYVAEWSANRIRRINPERVVTTLAGSISPGFSDGVGLNAQFNQPDGIVYDSNGYLFVTEHSNHAIRKVALDGTVTTLTGLGKAGSADGDQSVAQFFGPGGLGLDARGNLVVADTGNHSIRLIQFTAGPRTIRKLPPGFAPGVKLAVALFATPPSNAAVYAVEDVPPPGWKVENVSHNGFFDPATEKVKFGPFFDPGSRTLTYDVIPPATETGPKRFIGTASADGVSSLIGGDIVLDLLVLQHPADRNPPDNRISIDEVTAYSAAWRRGTPWPTAPNPIPIDYVTRAGFLWRNGETYAFSAQISSAPGWWISAAPATPARSQQTTKSSAVRSRSLATRQLAAQFVPSAPLRVTVSVHPSGEVSAYAVQDQIPPGWEVVEVSHSGEFDARAHQIKWGPFFDAMARVLSYRVRLDLTTAPFVGFHGTASFDGTSIPLGGLEESQAGIVMRSLRRLPTGELELEVIGRLGAEFDLETSANLIDWTPVMSVTNRTGIVRFADPDGPSMPQRFYRAVRR